MGVVNNQELKQLFGSKRKCDYCGEDLFEKDEYVIYWHYSKVSCFHHECALSYGTGLIIDSGKCKDKNKLLKRARRSQ